MGWLAFKMQWVTEGGAGTAKQYWGILDRTPGLKLAVKQVDASNMESIRAFW